MEIEGILLASLRALFMSRALAAFLRPLLGNCFENNWLTLYVVACDICVDMLAMIVGGVIVDLWDRSIQLIIKV